MGALSKALLLFVLNWVDAQLTLVWVRLNVATEGNAIMAHFLDQGDVYFFVIKLAVGAAAAYILYRCAHVPLAKRGLTFVLCLYVALMFVHAATGCVALGLNLPLI